MKLLLATGNAGKLREFRRLLEPLGHSLASLADLGLTQAPEPASTFVENALLKARSGCAASGLPTLADDSGIVVPTLGGAPGVHSARYAEDEVGPDNQNRSPGNSPDTDNNARLLRELDGVTDRRAYFYCVLVLLRDADDPVPLIASGAWHGAIGRAPEGANGFGYDPLFRCASDGRSAATLSPDEKSARSHRGHAWRQLRDQLDQL
ncbi:MAG: RdgB/HAM1 family non-canonical purine NTP pyrophosphatase [Pseudomonadota bacterium]